MNDKTQQSANTNGVKGYLNSLTDPEREKIQSAMGDLEAHLGSTTSKITAFIKAAIDPDGNGVLDPHHASSISRELPSNIDEELVDQMSAHIKGKVNRENLVKAGVIRPDMIDKGTAMMGELIEGKLNITVPKESMDIIAENAEPLISASMQAANRAIFDIDGDGTLTKKEMTTTISELNKNGHKIRSKDDLKQLTKGLNVTDEVIKAGLDLQNQINEKKAKRSETSDHDVDPEKQIQAPALPQSAQVVANKSNKHLVV
ncbi:MAG: hypothetical protein R3D71_03500 [Rickettsiales bacterium]